MKTLVACAALALSVTAAHAGGLAEPVMETQVVAQQTGTSAGGILVPLLLLILIAAAVSSSGGNGPAPLPPT